MMIRVNISMDSSGRIPVRLQDTLHGQGIIVMFVETLFLLRIVNRVMDWQGTIALKYTVAAERALISYAHSEAD